MNEITAFECTGCLKAFKTKVACQKHISTCFKHKGTKTCITCAYAEVFHNINSRHPKTVCRNQFFVKEQHFKPAYSGNDCSLNINCTLYVNK
jgi:hypothetical protein